MSDWTPDLTRSAGPRYLTIADAIAYDVPSGLPPQRTLAWAGGAVAPTRLTKVPGPTRD
jgi:hypothetical protein